jgi:hypothetical protein
MHVIIWRFTTTDPAGFERHYKPDGSWAQLFRRDPEFVKTDLLLEGDTYLTLDWWTSAAAYDAFRKQHAADYAKLDAICEALTSFEEKVGEFTCR